MPSSILDEATLGEEATSRFARADRLSRHRYDLVALRAGPLGTEAVDRLDLRDAVVDLKALLFVAADVDYTDCHRGKARLVPTGPLLEALGNDYEAMRAQGMFRSDDPSPSFRDLIDRLAALETELNSLDA